MNNIKKAAQVVLAALIAATLCIPTLTFANDTAEVTPSHEGQWMVADNAGADGPEQQASDAMAAAAAPAAPAAPAERAAAGTCTATVRYYENVTYEEPGAEPNEDGRYLMGTHTITGLSEGEVLDAWDYVVDIPGFFFFDGWPGKLTVSSNPENNVFELIYFREWTSAYTVNYYMMVGADLTADTWSAALAPQDVEFIKFDTEVFEDQPYGKLVEGDAYEYRLDGKYVVDSYPAQIRLGSDTDNNVLNVLYVPDSTHLPDDIEIPDEVFSVEGGAHGGSSGGATGSTPSGSGSSSSTAAPTLPEDEVLDRDEMEGLLPEGLTQEEINQLFQDFIGSQADAGQLEITDEMLSHPVDKEEALARIAAFNAGFQQSQEHAQGDGSEGGQTDQGAQGAQSPCDHLLCIIIIILLLIVAIIGYVLFARERKKAADLQEQLTQQQQNE